MPKRYFLYLFLLLTIITTQPVSAENPTIEDFPKRARNLTLTESSLQAAVEPRIEISQDRLNFGAEIGGTSTSPQAIIISNNGDGRLAWSAVVSDSWISASPLTGSGGTVVTVDVDPTGLATGTYNGDITFTSFTASNSPVVLIISLTVYDISTTSAPFGAFETPTNGSTVMSNIPVTGWVLDDIEVTSLQIYRDPVSGEGSGLVYIGDAVFVEGSRPDVEAAFPGYPNNSKAGWGYMLLTNSLPNGGNGTYTLHAQAADSSGNTVTLGSKTITVDNANAVNPFGSIDTPAQGGTASGTSFVNLGWVLTPLPNTIPTDGSTIGVWVDGVPLGHPIYNQYREDIATLFPGYNNSSGAGGYFYLDTTAYENGIHTIQWAVTDDAGNTDGIGSRYFTILNPVPAPVFVDDDYDATTPGWSSDHFDSIQDGIDQVAVGGVVDVAEGTYAEAVTLGKDVYVSLSGNVDISGDISISSGDFVSSENNLYLSGDLSTTGSEFNPNDGTVNFIGSGIQTISGGAVFYNATVNSGATVYWPTTATATTILTNYGSLQQTQFVNGSSDVTFLNTGSYGGLMVNANGVDLGNTTVTIRGHQDCSTTANETIQRCFEISPENRINRDATITFYFAASEIPIGLTCAELNTYHWNGASWDLLTLDGTYGMVGRECSAEPYSIRVTGVSNFSKFVLKSGSAPTAITLTDFSIRSGMQKSFTYLMLIGLSLVSLVSWGGWQVIKRSR